MKEYLTRICEYCGQEYNHNGKKNHISLEQWQQRKYCDPLCAYAGRKKQAAFTEQDIDFLKSYYKTLGADICAKHFGMKQKTLYNKILIHQKLNGPIPFKCGKQKPKKTKPIDIKREYSEAWIECKWILDRWHNQINKGRTGLISAGRLIRAQMDDVDEETLRQMYRACEESTGVISSILDGRYEKVG